MMKRIGTILLTATLVFAAASCSSSSSKSSGATTTTKAASSGSGSSGGGSGSSCGSSDGKNGVIRSFCGGSASSSFTIGSTSGKLSGGHCGTTAGIGFSVNIGTVVGPAFTGTKPDYVGMVLPEKAGSFASPNALITLDYGGKGYVLSKVSGTRTDKGGSFTATSVTDQAKVSGTFSC